MRRILSDALGRQGFEVVATAADGDEALAACREHRPDAMTLDLAMPGMDGIGVLKALKAGKAAQVPVVVVSAFSPAHGARAVDALAEGAFDLVAKPSTGEPLEEFFQQIEAKVRLAAAAREPVAPGVALLAPGGSHLRLGQERQAILSDDDAVGGLSPRADLTIADAAALYGDRLVLVVLTGMGNDGLAGARAVKR